jgi:DNA-binding MarR family transcriptional regulator
MDNTAVNRAANALHSLSIHLLRRARMADREAGLSPERLSLLSVLVFAGPRTINALAEIEGVSAPAISRIVSSLEATGFASRERSRSDAREVKVSATARGRRLVERGRKRRLEIIAASFSGLDRRDLAALADVAQILEKLEAKARENA